MTAYVIRTAESIVWRRCIGLLSAMTPPDKAMEAGDVPDAETELIAAAQRGDGDAFGRIVERYQTSIASQMRRFSRDDSVLEELVHDVFVEAYMSLGSFRSQAPLVHWLRKIAVRVGYRYWKHRSANETVTTDAAHLESVAEQIASYQDQSGRGAQQLGDLLSMLPVDDRLVLTLIYWDGCSIAEASELSGWSIAKVKVQAHRARKRLRRLIEESPDE